MRKTTLKLDLGTLVLGPLLASSIREHKDGIKAARLGLIAPEDMTELTVTLTHACAARVDPTVTRDYVESFIDADNQAAAFGACWGVSVPDAEPGETTAAVNPPT